MKVQLPYTLAKICRMYRNVRVKGTLLGDKVQSHALYNPCYIFLF